MRILITGIQPTGNVHIGNYLGFIRPLVKLQNDTKFDRRILTIADLHSISTGFRDPYELKNDIRRTAAILLSAGVDTTKTVLIQQSKLSEHTELMWILGAVITLPNLRNSTEFKEKAKRYKNNSVPIGLLTYPLLQAADILAYKSTHVLVGTDQNQHLDIARDAARSFNRKMGGNYFPIPERIFSTESRVKSLKNPLKKMSKSDQQVNSRISLIDNADIVMTKVRGSLSDCNPRITYEPKARPAISNLVDLYSAFSGMCPERIIAECQEMDTLDFKNKLSHLINEHLEPIRNKYELFMSDENVLLEVLEKGEEDAREIAKKTLEDVKRFVGLL